MGVRVGIGLFTAQLPIGSKRTFEQEYRETLELVHRATDRMTFAHGALAAARWILGRPPGLYGMSDVLGL